MSRTRASIVIPHALSVFVLWCFASARCLEGARPSPKICKGPALQVFTRWKLDAIRIESAQQTCEVLCELNGFCTAFVFNSENFSNMCRLYRNCEELDDGLPNDRVSIMIADNASGSASDADNIRGSNKAAPSASRPKGCSQRPLKTIGKGELKRQASKWPILVCWEACEQRADCAASVFSDDLTAGACKLYSSACPESDLASLPGNTIVKRAIARTCKNPPIETYSMARLDGIRGLKAPATFPFVNDPADDPDETSEETCGRLCLEYDGCTAWLHNPNFAVACRLYDSCDEADGVDGDMLVYQPRPTCSSTPYKTIRAWQLNWSFVNWIWAVRRDPESTCGTFCDNAGKCQASLYNPFASECYLYQFCKEVIVPTRNVLRYSSSSSSPARTKFLENR